MTRQPPTVDAQTGPDQSGPDQSGPDPREQARHSVLWRAEVVYAGGSKPHHFAAIIRNLSATGALIELDVPLAIGTPVSLQITDMAAIPAVLVRQDGAFHALQFIDISARTRAALASRARVFGLAGEQSA